MSEESGKLETGIALKDSICDKIGFPCLKFRKIGDRENNKKTGKKESKRRKRGGKHQHVEHTALLVRLTVFFVLHIRTARDLHVLYEIFLHTHTMHSIIVQTFYRCRIDRHRAGDHLRQYQKRKDFCCPSLGSLEKMTLSCVLVPTDL